MRFSKYAVAIVCLIWTLTSKAQIDHSLFAQKDSLVGEKNEVYFKVSSLGYHKNDEYYTPFANGQTFFGANLLPSLEYYFSKNIKFEAGLFLQKDFGTADFKQVSPTYRITIKRQNDEFIFGNLKSNLSHRYIEPLFDFNRLAYAYQENGFQYLFNRKKWSADIWADWNRMIYENSPFLEQINGGADIHYDLIKSESQTLTIPLQYILAHQGGQIDSIPDPISLAGNGAMGIEYSKKVNSKIVDEVFTKNYFCFWEDYFNKTEFSKKDGSGTYFNVGVRKKHHTIMLSYWQGNNFQGVLGTPVYMNQSVSFKEKGRYTEKRQLLFVRVISNIPLSDGMDLSLRFEPYYDFRKTLKETFTNGIFDFSNGLYIQLNKKFFVTKLKEHE